MRKKIKLNQTHNGLKSAITELLEAYGYIVCSFYAGGGINKQGQFYSRKNAKGVSDIIACSPKGRFVAIEVKAGKDELRQEQWDFLNRVASNGGLAIEARDVEEIKGIFFKN